MKISSLQDFIDLAKQVHGDRYDYSLVEFQSKRQLVKIICREHGPFFQTPLGHLNCDGCIRGSCSKSYGYSCVSAYKRTGVMTLYIVGCCGNNELFFKIGVTAVGIKSRMRLVPYETSPLFTFESPDRESILKAESTLLEAFANYKYSPEKSFAGAARECFIGCNPIDVVEMAEKVISELKILCVV